MGATGQAIMEVQIVRALDRGGHVCPSPSESSSSEEERALRSWVCSDFQPPSTLLWSIVT